MSGVFAGMYASVGRRSIPPEQLLRALILQILYTVRSERLLMEDIYYSVLFRWFVGLNMDDAVWDATVFAKNRDRLLKADIARQFFARVVEQAEESHLMSDETLYSGRHAFGSMRRFEELQEEDRGSEPAAR